MVILLWGNSIKKYIKKSWMTWVFMATNKKLFLTIMNSKKVKKQGGGEGESRRQMTQTGVKE